MLLDGLIRLPRTGADPRFRDLGMVAGEYAGLELDKSDPYRLRYAEIIEGGGLDLRRAGLLRVCDQGPDRDPGGLRGHVRRGRWADGAQGLDPDAMGDRNGLLGEAYQIKAAIALAAVTRIGIATEGEQVAAAERALRDRLEGQVAAISAIAGCDEVFRRDRQGRIQERPTTPAPSIRRNHLCRHLVSRAWRVADDAGLVVPLPATAEGKISIAASTWEPFTPFDPFIRAWLELENATKAYQFLARLRDPVVHPKYNVLVRTGRTSCSDPNIQNMPRAVLLVFESFGDE